MVDSKDSEKSVEGRQDDKFFRVILPGISAKLWCLIGSLITL